MLTIDAEMNRASRRGSQPERRLTVNRDAHFEAADEVERPGKPIDMLDCVQCMSMWAAIPFAFAMDNAFPQWVLAGLALNNAVRQLDRLGAAQGTLPTHRMDAPDEQPR